MLPINGQPPHIALGSESDALTTAKGEVWIGTSGSLTNEIEGA